MCQAGSALAFGLGRGSNGETLGCEALRTGTLYVLRGAFRDAWLWVLHPSAHSSRSMRWGRAYTHPSKPVLCDAASLPEPISSPSLHLGMCCLASLEAVNKPARPGTLAFLPGNMTAVIPSRSKVGSIWLWAPRCPAHSLPSPAASLFLPGAIWHLKAQRQHSGISSLFSLVVIALLAKPNEAAFVLALEGRWPGFMTAALPGDLE